MDIGATVEGKLTKLDSQHVQQASLPAPGYTLELETN
jgi:hypothetical protein